MGNGSAAGDAEWMPYRLPLNPVAKCDMATQTVGLFYPSQKDIQRKQDTDANATALEQQIRDRRPPLTAISPGRGEGISCYQFFYS
jgi:ribosomal protein L16 Arg81 hydroxylase